jgi:DNA-binding transcriptional LysR family regulator
MTQKNASLSISPRSKYEGCGEAKLSSGGEFGLGKRSANCAKPRMSSFASLVPTVQGAATRVRMLMSIFDDMTVFVRAAEVGSFSDAAKQLGIAKSIVSRRIVSLEKRLGTSMFHRTTRRLGLTETGLAYYERVRRILADVAEAEDVARRLHGDIRGKLRVAGPLSFGWRHLSPVVIEFLAAYPDVDVDLDLNDRRVDLISEGFDVAVRIGSLPDSSIIARTLAPCRHVVCASPAF